MKETMDRKWLLHEGSINREGVTMVPIFTPFENLIKPIKANKFVSELLGINEGDEYMMAKELIKLKFGNYPDWKCEVDEEVGWLWCNNTSQAILIFNNIKEWQTLLIAAGYNVFNIKDCRYE